MRLQRRHFIPLNQRLVYADIAFHNSTLGTFDEIQDVVALLAWRHFHFNQFNRFGIIHVFQEDIPVDLLYLTDLYRSKPAATQTNDVDTRISQGFTRGLCKWWHIFSYQRTTSDVSMGSDTGKLLHCARSAKDHKVVNDDVTGELD